MFFLGFQAIPGPQKVGSSMGLWELFQVIVRLHREFRSSNRVFSMNSSCLLVTPVPLVFVGFQHHIPGGFQVKEKHCEVPKLIHRSKLDNSERMICEEKLRSSFVVPTRPKMLIPCTWMWNPLAGFG